MTPLVYPRRSQGLVIVPSVVFCLAQFLFIAGLPSHTYGPRNLWRGRHEFKAAALPRLKAERPAVSVALAQPAALSLQSGLHEFHAVFSGQVLCGNSPCMAEVRISLASDQNADLKQVFPTSSDGRFECRMTFKENLQQPMDWHMIVSAPKTSPVELHGRKILVDDADLEINKVIPLF